MQINASMFTDPAMRAGLQQYYENKKADVIEAFKARESQPQPQEIKYQGSDGKTHIATAIPMTAEMMEKAFVSFDKWLEFQTDIYDNNKNFGPEQRIDMAQKQIESLKQHHPDTSSNVRSTFASNGELLAYVNADGGLVTHNGTEKLLKSVLQKANDMGLSGQSRVNYLHNEIKNTLSKIYPDLKVATYDKNTSPTKRTFANMWYPNHNVDQQYQSSLAEAKANLESAHAWHQQWQRNLNEMQSFLLSFQEVT